MKHYHEEVFFSKRIYNQTKLVKSMAPFPHPENSVKTQQLIKIYGIGLIILLVWIDWYPSYYTPTSVS